MENKAGEKVVHVIRYSKIKDYIEKSVESEELINLWKRRKGVFLCPKMDHKGIKVI